MPPHVARTSRAFVALAALLAADAKTRKAPDAVRLFTWGEIETVYGTYHLEREAADTLIEKFDQYGNRLVIDYEHATLSSAKTGKPAPAAGWIAKGGLEARDDGLYGRVTWTSGATKMIEAGEYDYFSPSFEHDAEGNITKLLPCALTNFPGTIGMAPLVAAKALDGRSPGVRSLASFGDVSSALGTMISARFGYDAFPCDVFDELVIFSMGYRTQGLLALAYEMVDGAPVLSSETPTKVEKTYRVVASGDGSGEETSSAPELEGTTKMKIVALAALLGLAPTASEEEGIARVSSLAATSAKLVALTGQTTPEGALGVVAGWQGQATEGAKAVAKLAALEAERSEELVASIVKEGMDAGKISPANAPKYLSICGANADGKGANVVTLRALVDTLPVSGPAGIGKPVEKPPAGDGGTAGGVAALSATDLRVARHMGITPEKFAEQKAKNDAAVATKVRAGKDD